MTIFVFLYIPKSIPVDHIEFDCSGSPLIQENRFKTLYKQVVMALTSCQTVNSFVNYVILCKLYFIIKQRIIVHNRLKLNWRSQMYGPVIGIMGVL